MAQKTTIKVSRETWRRLTDRKEPETTYDDIISGLLDDEEGRQKTDASTTN